MTQVTTTQPIWQYLTADLCIIPVSPQSKRPTVPSWKQYQERKPTSYEVDEWLQADVQSIAVVCGTVSGGLEIIDIDDNSDETEYTANDFWYPLRDRVGHLIERYDLPVWRTGGGGYQFAYRCEQIDGNLKLAWVPNEHQQHGRLIAIETRGQGGYAVIPPSLHPSGRRYEMLSGDLCNVPTIPPSVRDEILAAARSLDLMPYTKQEIESVRQEARQGHHSDGESVIDAYNQRNSVSNLLAQHGYTEGHRGRFSRPGQPDSLGVVVVGDVSFHWSSNDPLNRVNGTGRPLPVDAFNVYTQFEHGGDLKRAVREAARALGIAYEPKRQAGDADLFSDLFDELHAIDPDELESWAIDHVPDMAKLDSTQQAKLFIGLQKHDVTKTFCKNTLAKLIAESQAADAPNINSDSTKQADVLMGLVESRAQFFTGSDGGLYASVQIGDHRECHRLNSGSFNEYLSKLFYDERKTVVGAQARQDAKSVMAFMARERNEQVFTRVGMVGDDDSRVYIDLGTPEWNAIEVDARGWRIASDPPVFFRRASSALPLAMPVESTDISKLSLYLNIEDDQWPLVAAFTLASLYPHGPYPILGIIGEHGTAKSTTARVIKTLVDPSAAKLRSQPTQIRDLMIAGSNSWLMAFDNVSAITNDIADAMCTIATGGGFSTRANYTDGDEHIIDIMRPQIVTGIGDIFARGDLLDRTVVINPPVIPEDKRRMEKTFWRQFEQDSPALLGALLHGLSVGIKNLATTHLDESPRMADFAILATAAEPAYNDGGQWSFIHMYRENRDDGVNAILEVSPLARIVWEVVKVPGHWSGTSRQLYEKIVVLATEDDRKNKAQFPTAENRMKNMLQRIAPALRRKGVDVRYGERGKHGRLWTITRLSTGDGGDGQNG